MPKFRKKPVEIEAIQWTGTNVEECMKFCPLLLMETYLANGTLTIPTLEGKMIASAGDWIIKEPFPTGDRRFYPCKPDIFAATYEPVDLPANGGAMGTALVASLANMPNEPKPRLPGPPDPPRPAQQRDFG
jgi:hypothetical protein